MSFNPEQFRELVVRPTLEYLDPEIPYSREAEDLLLMTAAHESRLGTYLKQINGPALGVYQMEPDTLVDIWDNFLDYKQELSGSVEAMLGGLHYWEKEELVTNLMYATAMARVHYWRVPKPLPKEKDYRTRDDYLFALAKYAKDFYNTRLGKATPVDYYEAYVKFYKE